ncbi:MAG: DegT/DnrJ/EryC1/StrS family aminotransferase [Candidatus Marinimicrobia bacterium]|nr:DegT/DnrJ/EryC1/StrS family aminotransferase [Candidatus Neomarinimicrobiota bacterium]
MNVPFLDLGAQFRQLETELRPAIDGVLRDCNFILGEPVAAFERDFAAFSECAHGIGVASGLDAIKLILRGLGLGPGDEVITAANTFIATVLGISAVGATPVLVDIEPDTYNLDPAQVAAALTPRTRAIMPVHLYGHPASMAPLLELAERHQLHVIEDAAQAHGARYRGRRCGALGHAAAFSFYPGKNLGAYGDGGAVTTSDAALAEHIALLRNYGSRVKYHHAVQGENSRLDTIQAAILHVKLQHLEAANARRRQHAAHYCQALADVPDIVLPQIRPDVEPVFHLFVVRTPRRAECIEFLAAHGIAALIHYPLPIHLQPAYAAAGWQRGQFPRTEQYAEEILSLPMYPELTDAQVAHVAETLRAFHQQPNSH